jgi:hypothetical protein
MPFFDPKTEHYLRAKMAGVVPPSSPPTVAREGIGTSWGAYGQPNSAAIRRGQIAPIAPPANPLASVPGPVGRAARQREMAQAQQTPLDPVAAISGMVDQGALPAVTVPTAIPGGTLTTSGTGGFAADPLGTTINGVVDFVDWGMTPRSGAKERRERLWNLNDPRQVLGKEAAQIARSNGQSGGFWTAAYATSGVGIFESFAAWANDPANWGTIVAADERGGSIEVWRTFQRSLSPRDIILGW